MDIESEELKSGPGPQYNITVNVNAANYSLTEARRVDMTLYIPKRCQTYTWHMSPVERLTPATRCFHRTRPG